MQRFRIKQIVHGLNDVELYGRENGEAARVSKEYYQQVGIEEGAYFCKDGDKVWVEFEPKGDLPQSYRPDAQIKGFIQPIKTGEVGEREGPVVVTETSMLFHPDCNFKQWASKGEQMQTVARTWKQHLRWWVGDWILYGQERWPDAYAQFMGTSTEWTYGTLRNCVYVCRNVPKDVRNPNLSFEHHYLVAKFPKEKQIEWLRLADLNNMDMEEFRARLFSDGMIKPPEAKKERVVEAVEPEPKKVIDVVKYRDYADFEAKNCYLYPQKSVYEIAEMAFNGAREK